MIKAVVFDLGGVVVDFTNYQDGYYEYLARKGKVPVRRVRELDIITPINSIELRFDNRIGVTPLYAVTLEIY